LAELNENPLGGCVELEARRCGYAAMLPRSMLLPGSVALISCFNGSSELWDLAYQYRAPRIPPTGLS
jgi:hypothetical protein